MPFAFCVRTAEWTPGEDPGSLLLLHQSKLQMPETEKKKGTGPLEEPERRAFDGKNTYTGYIHLYTHIYINNIFTHVSYCGGVFDDVMAEGTKLLPWRACFQARDLYLYLRHYGVSLKNGSVISACDPFALEV